ncbi:hypothetical protein TNCV_4104681 [Trichonephila clavipes]|nr:hypothetical protein TNCV_4104681 [Trichonephila clavipes]
MVLIDEFRFQLCPDDHRGRVLRHPGQCARHTGPPPSISLQSNMSGKENASTREYPTIGANLSNTSRERASIPRRVAACIQARAIPDDARAQAMSFWDRTAARINFIRNVLPVPPGASKKIFPFHQFEFK